MNESEILCSPPTGNLSFGPYNWLWGRGAQFSSLLCMCSIGSLQRANGAHAAYSWRHDQIWGLVLVNVLNLFHTTLQCVFISGLLRKRSVSLVKQPMPALLSVFSEGCWRILQPYTKRSRDTKRANISINMLRKLWQKHRQCKAQNASMMQSTTLLLVYTK